MSRIVLGLAALPLLFVGTGFLLAMGSTFAMEAGETYEPFIIAHPVESALLLLGLALTIAGCALLHRALGPVPHTLGPRARVASRLLGAALFGGAAIFGYLITMLCLLGCSMADYANLVAYAAAPAMIGVALVTVSIPRMPWDLA